MRLLYGVQGTGNGHISRAREMARAFKQLDVEVDFLFTGRPDGQYFDMACFGGYQTRDGLTFVTEKGAVRYWKTLTNNRINRFIKDVRTLDLSGYDLVLNDYEPVSAWAAKRQGIPCIGISHQCAFLYDVPKQGEGWLDRLLIRQFAPSSQQIGLHWYHFGYPILPPIIPTFPSAPHHETKEKDEILVYLPFEELDQVIELLKRFSHKHFYCYHPEVKADLDTENLSLRCLNRESFQQQLHSCEGVIANGGFELPSEAISLGKKLLLKPLQRQYEQLSNVATLEVLGLAMVMERLDSSALSRWLDALPSGRVHIPDVALAIAKWVLEDNHNNTKELHQSLWQQVVFPEAVREVLLESHPSDMVPQSRFSMFESAPVTNKNIYS